MKTQLSFFLVLLSCCPLEALESHQTAVFTPDTLSAANAIPTTFAPSILCASCGAQLCEQCIENSQIKQSIVSYTLEEQRRTIALQQKTIELQTKKIHALQSELRGAATQRETMLLQQHVIDTQLAQISALHGQLQLYESNQQEVEQLRQSITELRELLVPLQRENKNHFALMAKRNAVIQELEEKNIPLQYALLATLAAVGRGKRYAAYNCLGQPQHFITRNLTPLSPETKEALTAWISLP